ncbi:MAG TPA: hypothetical protein ENN58_01970 [bacterium]|nr:hypothetical protein [bacterium]
MSIPIGTSAGEAITVTNHHCQEHSNVIAGREYWIDEYGNLRTVSPFGLADHALAGMKGVQYLLFDVIYRPDKCDYMRTDVEDEVRTIKLHPDQDSFFESTSKYIDGIREEAALFGIDPDGFIDIPATMGRYHRDRYDIQDNPGIYYDKVIRRGFGLDKMVALYTLSNSGWFDGKYGRESRANSLYQLFKGLENVVFNVLSDISTEESLLTFSPYCVDITDNNRIVRVNYPFNLLTNFGGMPQFAPEESVDPIVYEPIHNLCAMADSSNPGRYAPIHAGWIYFDKMWPNYWAMGNMANISADTSVLRRWTSNVIPFHERPLYAPVDVNEDEFLSKDEDVYYRARIPVSAMDNADSFGYRAWRSCREEILKTDINADYSTCITKVVWPDWYTAGAGEQRFANVDDFRKYLADKYTRYSPAYRVVTEAKLLKEKEVFDASSGSREPYSRLSIMETTLDQLNSFAAAHFGIAAFYVQRY